MQPPTPDQIDVGLGIPSPAARPTRADVLKTLRAVQEMRAAQRKFFTNKNAGLKAQLIGEARSAESRADIAVSDLIERLEGR